MRPTPKRPPTGAAPQKPRRTQEQRRAETRRKLIDAAIRLLRESGFARFTIREVAARSGLTSGAVQHHFPSNHDLLRGVVEAVYPLLRIEVCNPEMLNLAIPARVGRIVDIYWQKLYARPDYLIFWELAFGTREQDHLQKLLKTMQKESVAKGVSDLTRTFADIGMRPKIAFQLWTFIGSQLRGLALLSMFEGQRVLKDDLNLLKKSVFQLILDQSC